MPSTTRKKPFTSGFGFLASLILCGFSCSQLLFESAITLGILTHGEIVDFRINRVLLAKPARDYREALFTYYHRPGYFVTINGYRMEEHRIQLQSSYKLKGEVLDAGTHLYVKEPATQKMLWCPYLPYRGVVLDERGKYSITDLLGGPLMIEFIILMVLILISSVHFIYKVTRDEIDIV